jgi:N-acetylmuramic acid 6-phosphate etherase
VEALALPAAEGSAPDHVIAIDAGPELLTGSTRLKAGTATKLVLNILTTLGVGVGQGKVASNLMIDMTPTNDKLKDRAVRILRDLLTTAAEQGRLSAVPSSEALRGALHKSNWVILVARDLLLQTANTVNSL